MLEDDVLRLYTITQPLYIYIRDCDGSWNQSPVDTETTAHGLASVPLTSSPPVYSLPSNLTDLPAGLQKHPNYSCLWKVFF